MHWPIARVGCPIRNTREGAKFALRFESARSLSNNSDRVVVRHSRPANSDMVRWFRVSCKMCSTLLGVVCALLF